MKIYMVSLFHRATINYYMHVSLQSCAVAMDTSDNERMSSENYKRQKSVQTQNCKNLSHDRMHIIATARDTVHCVPYEKVEQ